MGADQKLWGGRFAEATHPLVETFTTSLSLDRSMWREDIRGSVAHVQMLAETRVIGVEEAQKILAGLQEVSRDLESGQQNLINPNAEDIHSEIERLLREKIGPVAGFLHTARSRNDQTVTDLRLWLRGQTSDLLGEMIALEKVILAIAREHTETIMPGMTHLQPAQPISLAHHLLCYFWIWARDMERLCDLWPRLNQLPLGAAALAGTAFPIDRESVAKSLGFDSLMENSLDAVSSRDFVAEFIFCSAMLGTHLSRLADELILWSHPSFGYLTLSDQVTTGSSIMPQKKNPDVAELIRGRTARSLASLQGILTLLKGLPLSYNRDLQDDKYYLLPAVENSLSAVRLMHLQLSTCTFHPARMAEALKGDFSNATDLADDLVMKGVPFREAHEVVGRVVVWCLENGRTLESLTEPELRALDQRFDALSVSLLPHTAVLGRRTSRGGTAPVAVREQLERAQRKLDELIALIARRRQ